MKFSLLILCSLFFFQTHGQTNGDGLVRLKYKDAELTTDLAVGLWANPLPMDYDEDGDIDLVVSCTDVPYNGTFYFENVSKDENGNPVFNKAVRIGDGMKNTCISYVDGEPRVLGSGVEFENFRKYGYTRPVGIFNASDILKEIPKKRFNDWKIHQ